jgi:hypothetical protein
MDLTPFRRIRIVGDITHAAVIPRRPFPRSGTDPSILAWSPRTTKSSESSVRIPPSFAAQRHHHPCVHHATSNDQPVFLSTALMEGAWPLGKQINLLGTHPVRRSGGQIQRGRTGPWLPEELPVRHASLLHDSAFLSLALNLKIKSGRSKGGFSNKWYDLLIV